MRLVLSITWRFSKRRYIKETTHIDDVRSPVVDDLGCCVLLALADPALAGGVGPARQHLPLLGQEQAVALTGTHLGRKLDCTVMYSVHL